MDDARSRDREENAPSTMWTLTPSELRKAKDIGFDTSAWTPEDPTTREGFRAITPEDSSVSVGDYGRAIVSGAAGLGAGVGALASNITGGAVGGDTRRFFNEISEDQNERMGPRARRAMSSEFFADEGKQSILEDFTASLGLKAASSLAPTVASIIPGGLAARAFAGASTATRIAAAGATSRGFNGIMNAGDVANQIYSTIDKMTDADLKKEAPIYAGYRSMMGEKDAREKYMSEVAGAAPVLGFIVGVATPGMETMMAQRFAGEAAKGMIKGGLKAGALEGTQEFAENTTGEFASQQALIIAGLKSGMDWEKVLAQGLEGAVVGAAMGGAGGGITNIGKGGKPKNGITVSDSPVDPAQALALGGKQAVSPAQPGATEQSSETNETVPETPQTLQDQQDKLVNGEIPAMLFTPGTEELAVPEGFDRYDPSTIEDPALRAKAEKIGVLHFDPTQLNLGKIDDAIRNDRINEILGYVQSKEEVAQKEQQGVPPVAVVESAPDGTERRAAATSMDRANEQAAKFQKEASPDSVVETKPAAAVLEGRLNPAQVRQNLLDARQRIEARRAAQEQPAEPQSLPAGAVPETIADLVRNRKQTADEEYDDAWYDYQAEKRLLAERGQQASTTSPNPLASQDEAINEGYRAFYEGEPIEEEAAPPAPAPAPAPAQPSKAEQARKVAEDRAASKAENEKAKAEKAVAVAKEREAKAAEKVKAKADKALAVAAERKAKKAPATAPSGGGVGAMSPGRKGKQIVEQAKSPNAKDEPAPAPEKGGAMTPKPEWTPPPSPKPAKQGDLFTSKINPAPAPPAAPAAPAPKTTLSPFITKRLQDAQKKAEARADEEPTQGTGHRTAPEIEARRDLEAAAKAAFEENLPSAEEVYTGPEQDDLLRPAKVEASTFVQSPRQVIALRKRLSKMVSAVEAVGKIPQKIYSTASDHLVFIKQAQDALKHYLGKTSPEALEKTNAFIADELAARNGDFEPMRKRRLQEGDQAKRQFQGDVETKASLTTEAPDEVLDRAEAQLQRELAMQEMDRQKDAGETIDIAAMLRAAGREDLIADLKMNKIQRLILDMAEGKKKISDETLTPAEAEILSFLNSARENVEPDLTKGERAKVARLEADARSRAEAYERQKKKSAEGERPNYQYDPYTGATPDGTYRISSEAMRRLNSPGRKVLQTIKLSDMMGRSFVSQGGDLSTAVANLISRLAGDVNIHVLEDQDYNDLYKDGDGVFTGSYIAVPARAVAAGPERMQHVFLHEGAHAALAQRLNADPLAASQIKAIANQVLQANPEAGKLYAFTNAQEFLAEALSNQKFQALLANTDLSPGLAAQLGISGSDWRGKSMWWGLVNKFAQWLGLDRTNTNLDALNAILAVTDRLAEGRAPTYEKGWAKYFDGVGTQGDLTPLSPQRGAPAPRSGNLYLTSEELLNGGKDRASAFQNAMSRIAVKGSTLDQLRQMAKGLFVDSKGDALERVVAGIQRMAPYAQGKREAAEKLAQQFINYARANPKGADNLSNLAIDATMANVRLGPTADNKHLGKGWRGAQGRMILPTLQSRFNKELDDAGRKLYQDMAKFYSAQQNEMTEGLIDNILKEVNIVPKDRAAFIKRVMNGQMSNADETLLKDKPTALKALKEANELRTIQGDYFPLMRNGDYVVTTRNKVGDTGGGVEIEPGKVEFRGKSRQAAMKLATAFIEGHSMKTLSITQSPDTSTSTDFGAIVHLQTRGAFFFESEAEAFKWRRENADQFDEVSQVQDKRQTGLNGADLTTSQFNTLMGSINRQENIDEETKNLMSGVIQQAAARMMSGNRVQQRSIIRRNVAGASTDFGRNLIQYGKATSGYLAKIKYMPEIREALKSMSDIASNDFSEQGAARSKVLNEVKARIDQNVISPTDAPVWLQDLMGLTFLGKLFSPMYSVINGMQPWMVTMPVLAGRFNPIRANAALFSAYNSLGFTNAIKGGIYNSYLGGKQFNSAGLLDTTDVVGSMKKKLAKEPDGAQLTQLIDELQERGAMSAGGFEMAQALAEGRGAWGTTLSKVDRIARQLPQAVEDVNRAVSAIAAYRLERAKGASEEKARAYAFDVVMNTQGDYSAVNAPRFFANSYLRPALQFKKYAQMMAYLLTDMAHKSFKGATPQERAQARKALLSVFAVQIAMAGALSLPGLEIAKLAFMIAAVFGAGQGWDDQEEKLRKLADDSFGKTWGELITKGVISRAIGIDISQRVSLSDMFIFGEPKKYDKENLQGYFAQTLFGAPGSTAFDFVTGWQEIQNGEPWEKGASKMIPVKVIADSLKAVNNYNEGKATRGEQLLNAFGARSARQSEKSRETGESIRKRDDMLAQRKQLQSAYLRRSTKAGELAVLRGRMAEFNKTAPFQQKLFPNNLDKIRAKQELETQQVRRGY